MSPAPDRRPSRSSSPPPCVGISSVGRCGRVSGPTSTSPAGWGRPPIRSSRRRVWVDWPCGTSTGTARRPPGGRHHQRHLPSHGPGGRPGGGDLGPPGGPHPDPVVRAGVARGAPVARTRRSRGVGLPRGRRGGSGRVPRMDGAAPPLIPGRMTRPGLGLQRPVCGARSAEPVSGAGPRPGPRPATRCPRTWCAGPAPRGRAGPTGRWRCARRRPTRWTRSRPGSGGG